MPASTPRRRAGGFTLIELLITTVIAAVVAMGVAMMFISQTRLYEQFSNRRIAQASARQGLNFVEQRLRMAGYGLDPYLAIRAFDGYDVVTDAHVDNYPDAITLYMRDPLFQRRISGPPTDSALTLDRALSERLPRGQVLLVLCNGARQWTYVTLGAAANAGDVALQLNTNPATAESPVTTAGAAFRQQSALRNGGPGCFRDPVNPPHVVKVERFSFFVQIFDDDANPFTPRVPYLMMHRGLDLNDNGTIDANDAQPVAAGVEQLQIAYLMNSIDAQLPAILGVNATAPVPWGESWDVAANRPSYEAGYADPRRLTSNPANIRQIRLSLVGRSHNLLEGIPGDDYNQPALSTSAGTAIAGVTPWRQMENLGTGATPFNPRGGGFLRTMSRVSVAPKNLLMRAQFLPPASPSAGYGGG